MTMTWHQRRAQARTKRAPKSSATANAGENDTKPQWGGRRIAAGRPRGSRTVKRSAASSRNERPILALPNVHQEKPTEIPQAEISKTELRRIASERMGIDVERLIATIDNLIVNAATTPRHKTVLRHALELKEKLIRAGIY
jgi:hypothetical protein